MSAKYQHKLKRILLEILGSNSTDLDPLIGLAANIFTASLEIFVQTWAEKIGILTQIMDPSVARNSKSDVFPMKPAAYNIISTHLLSRCYDLKLIKSLFSPVTLSRTDGQASEFDIGLIHKFLDAILQCIANDFDNHIQFLKNTNSEYDIPCISDTSKQTVEFLLLIHSYLMSISESGSNESGSETTPLHDVLVSHLSTFFQW